MGVHGMALRKGGFVRVALWSFCLSSRRWHGASGHCVCRDAKSPVQTVMGIQLPSRSKAKKEPEGRRRSLVNDVMRLQSFYGSEYVDDEGHIDADAAVEASVAATAQHEASSLRDLDDEGKAVETEGARPRFFQLGPRKEVAKNVKAVEYYGSNRVGVSRWRHVSCRGAVAQHRAVLPSGFLPLFHLLLSHSHVSCVLPSSFAGARWSSPQHKKQAKAWGSRRLESKRNLGDSSMPSTGRDMKAFVAGGLSIALMVAGVACCVTAASGSEVRAQQAVDVVSLPAATMGLSCAALGFLASQFAHRGKGNVAALLVALGMIGESFGMAYLVLKEPDHGIRIVAVTGVAHAVSGLAVTVVALLVLRAARQRRGLHRALSAAHFIVPSHNRRDQERMEQIREKAATFIQKLEYVGSRAVHAGSNTRVPPLLHAAPCGVSLH